MVACGVRQWRRFVRAQAGAVYIELAVTVLLLVGLFIGTASIGAQTIFTDRDARAVRGGADLLYILDTDTRTPVKDDFNVIGAKMAIMATIGSDENFEITFHAFEVDHLGAGLRKAWTGRYGTMGEAETRVHLDVGAGVVRVDGVDFDLRDDERLLVVEMVRMQRGLFRKAVPQHYSKAVVLKYDPSHA